MQWIYLSPHLDDAAFSCGGLIWQQTQAGENVAVWTICAGDPPPGGLSMFAQVHHKVWEVSAEEVITVRRKEDADACAQLGAAPRYFSVPDAIYRKHPKTGEAMYTTRDGLFGGLDPGDEPTIQRILVWLAENIPATARIVVPLTVGNHVDHQMVRLAASRLEREVWYYPDFPYTREFPDEIPALVPEGYRKEVYLVSAVAMRAWNESARQFRSQLSTFWETDDALRLELQKHADTFGGIALWRPGLKYWGN